MIPVALAVPLAVVSVLALLYAAVHDANTRRRQREQAAPETSRPQVQQRPGRDSQSVLDQPWWENA